jgi:sortase A
MSKRTKKIIIISIIIVLIIIAIISALFIEKYLKNKSNINNVLDIYSIENIQERIDNENTTDETFNTDNLMLQIDGESVLGVINIDKIGYEGLIYEGTSLSILAKGVGHFTNSPYLYGNVCLAAHNTNKFWAKLHTLQNGDKITYTSFLGTKEYEVTEISSILETDWSKLSNTDENILTLITCIKGQKDKRLCVQAKEI